MIYIRLFIEFAKIGLFSIGGGMATIPFLQDLSRRTGWFTIRQLTDFIAISEATPGSLAINLATFAGYETAGVAGSILATLGIMFPALILITAMASLLHRFRENRYVERAFYGLRPCVLALIGSAFLGLVEVTMFKPDLGLSDLLSGINLKAVVIFLAVLALMNIRRLKEMHPVFFLGISAVAGIAVYSL